MVRLFGNVPALAVLKNAPANIFWTALPRAASFLIPLVVARRFGAGPITDAFFLAFGIASFFVAVGGVVLEQSIVPHVTAIRYRDARTTASFWSLVRPLILVGLGLAVLAFVGIELVIVLQQRIELRPFLTVLRVALIALMPLVVLVGSASGGILIGLGRYPTVSLGLVLRAVTSLLIVFLQPFREPFFDLLLAFLTGEVVRALFNTISSLRQLAVLPEDSPNDGSSSIVPSFPAVWRVTWPVSLSMVAAAVSPIVDRVVAAGITTGGVSIIEYSEKAFFVIAGTVVVGLQVTALTRWSGMRANPDPVWRELTSTIKLLAAVCPLLIVGFLYAGPLVAQIIMGRALAASTPQVGLLVGLYLIAILPYTVGGLTIRALLARRYTKPIIVLGSAKLGANIVGDVLFAAWIGLPGIPLATIVAESLVAGGALLYARHDLQRRSRQ